MDSKSDAMCVLLPEMAGHPGEYSYRKTPPWSGGLERFQNLWALVTVWREGFLLGKTQLAVSVSGYSIRLELQRLRRRSIDPGISGPGSLIP